MPNHTLQHTDNPEFQEFVSKAFDKTIILATIEELAEFAFGSTDSAIQAFEDHKKD